MKDKSLFSHYLL